MASLVLGAAGSLVGSFMGPLGASIGWAVGSALGSLLFPQKQEGPRLNDLKLQDSQYGKAIPILYGRGRCAGNVIWQTDLEEHSETTDGKGGPEVTTYSYTASFAVQLCEGPVIAIPRIWADGRIIHDATDYNTDITIDPSHIRFYYGDEEQLPDPTMEAHVGAGLVPAHRGTAYVVFTDLPMGEFGNRIPNLEFEIFTEGQIDARAHVVAEAALPHAWATESFIPAPGIGVPCIEKWTPGGAIIVKNMSPGMYAREYSAEDLSYVGETNYLGPGSTTVDALITGPSATPVWIYSSAGTVLINGFEIPVFAHTSGTPYQTQNSLTNPALAGGNIYTLDGGFVMADYELAASAGIPEGAYISGVVISQDKTAMLVFTAPSTISNADAWYMLVDGEVVRSGTFGGSADYFSPSYHPMGHWSAGERTQCAMMENNREYFWFVEDAPDPRRGNVFRITDANEIVADPVALYATLTNYGDGLTFRKPSCYVFKEGYCGAIMGKQIGIYSRVPVAEPNGPLLSAVVENLSHRAGLTGTGSPTQSQVDVTSLANDYVQGYLIGSQTSVRSAVDQLRAAYFFDAVESGDVVRFVKRGGQSVATIPDDDLAAHGPGEDNPALLPLTRAQEVELPRVYTINFIDQDADYQTGTQQDRREVTLSELEKAVQLAIVMQPSQARSIAQVLLFDEWIERERFRFWTTRKYAFLEPTDPISVQSRVIRLTKRTERPSGVIEWEGVAAHSRMWVAAPPGAPQLGYTPTLPAPNQPTDAILLDIPLIQGDDAAVGYYVGMAGRNAARWKGAQLFRSDDGGTSYTSVVGLQSAATFGQTTTALGTFAGGNVFDELNSVEVTTNIGGGELSSATEALVLNGANMALIGSEVIRFKTATMISARRYRLTGLLRGRRGTEWAMGAHSANERFVMLDTVTDQAMPVGHIAQIKSYKAASLGQAVSDTDAQVFVNYGVRNKPYAPVHLGGGADVAGNVMLQWARRTRIGGAWIDGSDVPLSEESEQYIVEIWNAAYTECARVVSGVSSMNYTYTGAMQVADFGANQETVYFRVAQVGAHGLGYAADGRAAGRGGSNGNPGEPVPPQTGGIDPLPPSNVDEAHYANFRALYNAGGRNRQLAYWYSIVGPVAAIGWYGRFIPIITADIFGGDFYSFALWTNDADGSGRPDSTEMAMLAALAEDASS